MWSVHAYFTEHPVTTYTSYSDLHFRSNHTTRRYTMRLIIQLLTVMCCFIFSSQGEASDSNFTLVVDNLHVLAVVNTPFNFTVGIEHVKWSDKPLDIEVKRNQGFGWKIYFFVCRYFGNQMVFMSFRRMN